MSKTGGLLAFAAGIAAGVAAAIFSDEKNRAVANKELKEVKKNPRAYAEKLAKKTEAKVRKVTKSVASKATKKSAKRR